MKYERYYYPVQSCITLGKMLRTALGLTIATWLEDPFVIEVMLNPDGRLWVDRLGKGVSDTADAVAAASSMIAISTVATGEKAQAISAEMLSGEGLI